MSNYGALLSDQPTIDDMLGYQKAAETLANIIVDKNTATPLTIGIFGEWGTGKTSLMKMIQLGIETKSTGNDGIFTIWFDPWRYDKKESIWEALIQTILFELYNNARIKDHKLEIGRLTAKFLGIIAAKTVEVVTVGALDLIETLEQVEKIVKPKFDEIRFWNKFESNFSKIVEGITGEEGRLVVFIDDLDRCLPENAIQVLEAIKLFLAQRNCIFVLGVDKQGIEEAITLRYKDNPQMTGVKYLEKIIQLPFPLPMPQRKDIQAYTQKLVGEPRNHQVQRVIEAGAGGNPRRIKRFINAFNLLRSIASGISLNESVLAKLVMIQMRFPKFYLLLCRDHYAISKLKESYEGKDTIKFPERDIYEEYLDNTELIDFLDKTKDIDPEHGSWRPYLRLTEMANI
jgi:hypothetical protein